LLGVLVFDSSRLLAFRPKWIDLSFVIWCMARFGSSVVNGYGWYDGLSQVEYTIIIWGIPWLFGRLYFSDAQGMRALAMAIVVGGLIYVPLCLLEVKMSPQLHIWVYGFHQHSFDQTRRFGGWRPTVFLQHGLMVGMWMCMSGLTCWWLWITGIVRRIVGLPISWVMIAVIGTAILCKSFGAIALMAIGTTTLWAAWRLKRLWPLVVVLALLPAYMTVRLSGAWSGGGLVELAGFLGNPDRANSLACRFNSEDQFIGPGWHKPLLGYRGWYNTIGLQDQESQLGIPDALWMIEFTGTGLLGLACLLCYMLGPPIIVLWSCVKKDWRNPTCIAAIGLTMVAILWMCDSLFNAMLNPMFMLALGGLSGWRARSGADFRTAGLPEVPAENLKPRRGARHFGI
jgi:hypothetical protein